MKIEAASSEELRSIARRLVRDLPMLPVCLSALVQFDADDEHSFERILSVARNEPCMALRIFVLANHRYASEKLTSLRKAVQVLGVDGMDELTHHHSVAEVFVPITEEERLLWFHSLHVSSAAKSLAATFPDLGIHPGLAAHCGLIHDLGRFLRYEHLEHAPKMVEAAGYRNPSELLRKEREVLGMSHVELGTVAAEVAHLPEPILFSIGFHHTRSENLPSATRKWRMLVEVTALADEMAMYCQRHHQKDTNSFQRRMDRFFKTRAQDLESLYTDPTALHELMITTLGEAHHRYSLLQLGRAPRLSALLN